MSKFNWANENNFRSGGANKERLTDVVEMVSYPEGEYGSYRMLGNAMPTATHWLNTKAKDPKQKRPASFPVVCLGFDPETMEVDANKCPYCKILEHSPRIEVRTNVIDRQEQENEPKRLGTPAKSETRLREWNGGKFFIKAGKGTGIWTPVRVLNATPLIGKQIQELAGLNKHKINGERKQFGPQDAKYGFDIMIKYNSKAKTPNDMYIVQKGEVTRLTAEELEFPIWAIPPHSPETPEEALKQAKRIKPFLTDREGNLIFKEEAEKSQKKKKNQFKDNFDEEDDVEDDEDDEDEDDRRSKKSKSKSKSKKSSNWDDEDEDDDEPPFDTDDEDEEDDDEDTRRSSKSKSKVKAKSKSSRYDEDDEDEEEERPRKSTKSSKVKMKSKSSRRAIRIKSQFRA